MVVDLVDSGIIRILDLAFVTRHADGSITAVDILGPRRGRSVRPLGLRGRLVGPRWASGHQRGRLGHRTRKLSSRRNCEQPVSILLRLQEESWTWAGRRP